jgi:hypothetical protein
VGELGVTNLVIVTAVEADVEKNLAERTVPPEVRIVNTGVVVAGAYGLAPVDARVVRTVIFGTTGGKPDAVGRFAADKVGIETAVRTLAIKFAPTKAGIDCRRGDAVAAIRRTRRAATVRKELKVPLGKKKRKRETKTM